MGATCSPSSFCNLGNLRAILHQGVDAWLALLEDDAEDDEPLAIVQDLRTGAAACATRSST